MQLTASDKSNIPRVVIAALKGGAGKTVLSVGLIAAIRATGLSLGVFKKGPDYIDAGWLGLAAGGDCYNLDAYLFDQDTLRASFAARSLGKDLALVEGNRGVFDGVDSSGSYSTAELAKLLKAPVILIVDATKVTRTAAALVLGCQVLDSDLNVRAVILNRVAGTRHERVLRESIEDATSIPVIGSVMKLPLGNFPQRHLGLLPLYEHPQANEFIGEAARVVKESVDLDKVIKIASAAGEFGSARVLAFQSAMGMSEYSGIRIGILKDAAFQFYYPENLEALQNKGADLVEISALEAKELPELDGLYIGGGFPETHAEVLARNWSFKESVRAAVEKGLPVYAECGGLMYLSRNLQIDDAVFPMVGIFPVDSVLERQPQGHGYIRVEVTAPNPFYPQGQLLTGHEFHYSHVTAADNDVSSYAFTVLRGHGMDGTRDGICSENVLATYLHVHALGEPLWAKGILKKAKEFRKYRRASDNAGSKTGAKK